MQIGKCILKISATDTVAKIDVTPAEVLLLKENFGKISGGVPIHDLEVTGEDKRTAHDEMARLGRLYTDERAKKAFPGDVPKLPETFKDAGVDAKQLVVTAKTP